MVYAVPQIDFKLMLLIILVRSPYSAQVAHRMWRSSIDGVGDIAIKHALDLEDPLKNHRSLVSVHFPHFHNPSHMYRKMNTRERTLLNYV